MKRAKRKDVLHANSSIKTATRTVNALLPLPEGRMWIPTTIKTGRRVPAHARVGNLRAQASRAAGAGR